MMFPFAIWFTLLGMSAWPIYYYEQGLEGDEHKVKEAIF